MVNYKKIYFPTSSALKASNRCTLKFESLIMAANFQFSVFQYAIGKKHRHSTRIKQEKHVQLQKRLFFVKLGEFRTDYIVGKFNHKKRSVNQKTEQLKRVAIFCIRICEVYIAHIDKLDSIQTEKIINKK